MNVCLAMDATNRWISAGIFGPGFEFQETIDGPRDSFPLLLPLIQKQLRSAQLDRPDWIVCAVGPGSFTGLRICVTTARDLSQMWDIPVFGIDSLSFYCYDYIRKTSEADGPESSDSERFLKKEFALMIDGKQKKVYARRVSLNISPGDIPQTELYDAPPSQFIGGDTILVADDPETVRGYMNETDGRAADTAAGSIRIEKMALPETKNLMELAVLCEGRSRAHTYEQLLPRYMRDNPATAKAQGPGVENRQ